MLWADNELVVLDSGREVTVPGGVIGVDFRGERIYVGGVSVAAVNSSVVGGEATPLTDAEIVDIAKHQRRVWQDVGEAAMRRIAERDEPKELS